MKTHESWENVEPLVLKDYCTYNYTDCNEMLHNCYQIFIPCD